MSAPQATSIVEQRAREAREHISAYRDARRAQAGHTPGQPDPVSTIHVGLKQWAHLHDADLDALLEGFDAVATQRDAYRDAFEKLHARVTRDLNPEAGEATAPQDERWALTLDLVVQFADELAPQAEAAAEGGPR